MEQVRVLFFPAEYPYTGTKGPWDCDSRRCHGGAVHRAALRLCDAPAHIPAILPGHTGRGHRPPDRPVAQEEHGVPPATRGDKRHELEFYNGVREILTQPRYAHNVAVNVGIASQVW